MAAWVEATTREMGQSLINPDKPSVSASALPGDTEKPALRSKPHLMPKPFSLQRNATVRPIRAPKTNFSKPIHRAVSSETLLNTTDTHVGGPKTSNSNGTVIGSGQSAAPKPVPLTPKPDLQAKPKPEPTNSPEITASNNQTGPNSKPDVTAEDMKSVQPRTRAKSVGAQDQKTLNQKAQGEAGDTEANVKVPLRCWPARNRLSAELTSKFESLSQPEKEPPNSPSAVSESKSSTPPVEIEEAGDEELVGGSIKRRISLLFDRSAAFQRRDTFNKKDITPAEISIDIKQRIQNLSLDTRLPSTGAPKSPPSEKTNERSSERETETVPVDKPPNTTEIKNSAASMENAEQEENNEVKEDMENYVTVPVYRRVGISIDAEKKRKEEEEKQRKDEQLEKERQQQERERLLEEEERKAKEIERQQEEERKQEEEKQRQMEERRKQEEERKRRIEEERKEKERERQREQERQIEEEKERQREEERLRQEKLKKEREMEEERRRIQETERQKEEERLRQEREKEERLKKEREMEEKRLKEEERLRQEREKERLKKEKEIEEEKQRVQEMERQKEEERLRKKQEIERLRKEKEMEEERLKEEERLRQEREKERLKKEMEEERQRIQEIERQKEEERLRKELEIERLRKEKEMEDKRLKEKERLRQEREKERLKKEKEMEEERRRIQEIERQKEEERLRKELEIEKTRKEKEMEEERLKEEERLRQEREKERLKKEKEMEEERRRIQEMERLRQEREKEERLKKEREMEEERLKEEVRLRQEREKERMREEKEMEEERRRIQEIQRQKEEERLRQEREKEERLKKEREMEEERLRLEKERLKKGEERRRTQEAERRIEEENLRQERENARLKNEMEMDRCKAGERLREEVPTSYDLIPFGAEEPAQTLVSPQLPEVLYDDFSVKPRRWGTRARRSSTPSPPSEPLAAPVQNLQPEPKSNDPGSQEPFGDRVNVEDLMGFDPEASSPQNSSYKHTESREQASLSEESKPEDLLVPRIESDEGQLKDCEPEEDRVAEEDIETLIGELDEQRENNDETDGQNRLSQALQRLTRVRQRNTSTDSDGPDVPDEKESKPLPVLETAAPLDSSVLRSKVDLAKKRSIKRCRPTRAVRQRAALPALTEGTNPDWRFCDSTDAKDLCSNGGDSESEEEPSQDVTSSPAPSQPKRVPMFPGMDPSALMAQLKRRSGVVEADSPTEAQTPPAVPARSPRTPTMALGPRVLPPVDAKDSGSGSSPSWLLELKSKKRMNQPESEA